MENFEGVKGNHDGIISTKEFVDYYTDLSMSVPSDEYFVRMMEQTWCISEQDQSAEYKEKLQYLLMEMKPRILALTRNSTDPQMLKKVFEDFNVHKTGHLTVDEISFMLPKLQMSVERKYLYPLFKVLDANNSGAIEFDEWCNYLCS